jgi:hypothetical protein
MMKALLALLLVVAGAHHAVAQGTTGAEKLEYSTVAQALAALRAKPGVSISAQSGWTVIEDRSTLTLWSFTPAGHRAHPAAIRRTITQEGGSFFVNMNVLCEAPKPDCDAVVADFEKLNGQMREDLQRRKR